MENKTHLFLFCSIVLAEVEEEEVEEAAALAVRALRSLSSSTPHLSISVAEEVRELRIDSRSVFVHTIPVDVDVGVPEPATPDLGGIGGGGPRGISEARRRVVEAAGIVARVKSE